MSGLSIPALEAAGHDVVWAGAWDSDPGDEEILARADRESRVLVTLDKDFGDLAVRQQQAHCGIVRLVDLSVTSDATACLDVLSRYIDEIKQGAIITIEPGRVRIRSTRDE
jgi:predicted nuclease of predicted toxin-antitoxin system